MGAKAGHSRVFTLLEVTFATGILFLTLILLLGALSHLALLRELGERRHLAALCLNHCLEQLHNTPPATLESIQLEAAKRVAPEKGPEVEKLRDVDGLLQTAKYREILGDTDYFEELCSVFGHEFRSTTRSI